MNGETEEKMKTNDKDIRYRAGHDRALLALISCIFVFLFTMTCVVICLLEKPSARTPERGALTFHLFTVFSNLVSAVGAGLSIPFAAEGVRKERYHVPNWAVRVLYMGTISVTITFIFAVVLIFPVKGADLAFGGTNLFMHLLCPMLSILLFLGLESEHQLRKREIYFGLIPFFVYACVYIVEVGIIGEANGGWRDVYQLTTKVPMYVSIPMMFALAFFVANRLRRWHNVLCAKRTKMMAKKIIDTIEIPEGFDIMEAVEKLAEYAVPRVEAHEIVIPVDIIGALMKRLDTEKTLRELSTYYLECFLDKKGL